MLNGCSAHICKNLKQNTTFFFYDGFEEGETHYTLQRKEGYVERCPHLYDISGQDGNIHIAISALVGKNGDGKSTLIELIIRIVNNFAVSCGFTVDQESLLFISGLRAVLYYELNGSIIAIVCKDKKVQMYKDGIKVFEGTDSAVEKHWVGKPWANNIFYTEIINFSLYAYNSLLLKEETTGGKESWIDALFHKNDSYQTPIVLNPMRTEGNIDINREEYLSRQRLMAIFTESLNQEQRKISETQEAVSYRFRVDANVKLLSKTIGSFLTGHVNDYSEWEIIDTAPDKKVGDAYTNDKIQTILNRFAGFWEGFGPELIKNRYLLQFGCRYLPRMSGYSRSTDLRRYLKKVDKLIQSGWGYYGNLKPRQYYSFLYSPEYKALNYAHLNRFAFVFAVWKQLQRKGLIDSSLSISEVLKDSRQEKNANILYLLYKIISVIETYSPYKDRGVFQNSKFTLFEDTWEDWLANKQLRITIDEVLEEDSHRTLKLQQTINYLKGPMKPFDVEKNQDYYKIGFEQLQKRIAEAREVIPKGKNIPTIKLLLPPVFAGDIMIKQNDQTYSMSELSSGERQRLNTVGSLVYHLRNLDTAVTNANHLNYTSVNVVLEEVELYFHPEYQRGYVKFLLEQIERIGLKHIKNINMCFVTHSPFVLSDIPQGNVLYLQRGEPAKEKVTLNTFGANIGDLIRNSFFLTDGAMGDFARSFIDRIVVAIQLHKLFAVEKTVDVEQLLQQEGESERPYYDFIRKDDGTIDEEKLRTQYSIENLNVMIDMIDEPLVRNVLKEDLKEVVMEQ